MKRVAWLIISLILSIILSLVLVLGLVSCTFQTRQDEVLDSLGKYEKKQFWTHGEFQDYTDFGIYSCEPVDLEENSYFTKVTTEDITVICEFIDDYEGWIETFRTNDPHDDLVQNYHFNRALLDTEDYFYIYSKDSEHPDWNYDIWVFDAQTNVLYYFHNNI